MTMRFHRYLIRVLVASGSLMLMTGCDVITNPASPVDLSASSSELAIIIHQFAREALAAFLF